MPPRVIQGLDEYMQHLSLRDDNSIQGERTFGNERWCVVYPDITAGEDVKSYNIPSSAMFGIMRGLRGLPLLYNHHPHEEGLGRVTRGRITENGLEAGFQLETTPNCRAERENVSDKLDSGVMSPFSEVSLSHVAKYTDPTVYEPVEVSLCPRAARPGAVVLTTASYKGIKCSLVEGKSIPVTLILASTDMTDTNKAQPVQTPTPEPTPPASSVPPATSELQASDDPLVALVHELEGEGVQGKSLQRVIKYAERMLAHAKPPPTEDGASKPDSKQEADPAVDTSTETDAASVPDEPAGTMNAEQLELYELRAQVTRKPRADIRAFMDTRLAHLQGAEKKKMAATIDDLEVDMLNDPRWRRLLLVMDQSDAAGKGMNHTPTPPAQKEESVPPPVEQSGGDAWRSDLLRLVDNTKRSAIANSGARRTKRAKTATPAVPPKMATGGMPPAALMHALLTKHTYRTPKPMVELIAASDNTGVPTTNRLPTQVAVAETYWRTMNHAAVMKQAGEHPGFRGGRRTTLTHDNFDKMTVRLGFT